MKPEVGRRDLKPEEVLFVGLDATPQTWYRCALPARSLGCDWVGLTLEHQIVCGEVRGSDTRVPDISAYKTVVLQQPGSEEWLKRINILRSLGIRVLYETDDYLHGVKEIRDHPWRGYFTTARMRWYDLCMKACDGTIVSTPFLADRYAKHSEGRTHVCRNGIDPARYDFHRRPRDWMTLGWAGATGHVPPLVKWMNGGILKVLEERPDVKFTVIGFPQMAEEVAKSLGAPERCTGIPWSAFDTYPSAMTTVDVMMAPAGETKWARGKSDLRWLEASALGIPCVCDGRAYPEASLRSNGPDDAVYKVKILLDDPGEASEIGEEERTRVLKTRAFPEAAEQWNAVLHLG